VPYLLEVFIRCVTPLALHLSKRNRVYYVKKIRPLGVSPYEMIFEDKLLIKIYNTKVGGVTNRNAEGGFVK